MFTGIIQAIGTVDSFSDTAVLSVRLAQGPIDWEPWVLGESIAIDGCCLTLVSDLHGLLRFDLSEETLTRTTLGASRAGDLVNLERAMRPTDRLGGHFVQGHVDGVGQVVSTIAQGEGATIRFRAPEGSERYLIDKGSITIDGISLTVVQPNGREFDVAVIPHTLRSTNLTARKPGDRVNLEFDVLAKHVERLLTFRP